MNIILNVMTIIMIIIRAATGKSVDMFKYVYSMIIIVVIFCLSPLLLLLGKYKDAIKVPDELGYHCHH